MSRDSNIFEVTAKFWFSVLVRGVHRLHGIRIPCPDDYVAELQNVAWKLDRESVPTVFWRRSSKRPYSYYSPRKTSWLSGRGKLQRMNPYYSDNQDNMHAPIHPWSAGVSFHPSGDFLPRSFLELPSCLPLFALATPIHCRKLYCQLSRTGVKNIVTKNC